MTEPLKRTFPSDLQGKDVRCIAKEQEWQVVFSKITTVIKLYLENSIIIRNLLLIIMNTHNTVIILSKTKNLINSIYQSICIRKDFTLLIRRTITYERLK